MNGQSDKGFLLTSTFVPKELSAPALGLYTCIKALKYITRQGVRWAFTGPLVLWFHFCSHSLELWELVNFRTFCAKKQFKDFICFICRIREVHFSELAKGICHLSAARRQIGHKTAVCCQWKTEFDQGKVREFCFCMRVATVIPESDCCCCLFVSLFLYFSFSPVFKHWNFFSGTVRPSFAYFSIKTYVVGTH